MAFRIAALTKCGLARTLIALWSVTLFSGSVLAEKAVFDGPPNVIFETDMCLDVDDAMALAMMHALHDRREANLVAVTVSIDHKWCAPYVDVLNTFYGRPHIPIGVVRNGLSFEAKVKGGSKNTFAQLVAERKDTNGSFVYPHRLTDGARAPDAVSLLRKTLVAQPDNSVVMIQVGHTASFAQLLDSRPDAISALGGRDLIAKKVRLLSVMAGGFDAIALSAEWGGKTIKKGEPDANLLVDIPLAQKLFSEWPTTIVASGTEVGMAIPFPALSIERDFSYVRNHPVAEAYLHLCVAWAFPKCPHNHHTLDPTAVLYALRPDRNYFSLSKPGKITVLDSGGSRFDEDKNGKHYHLTLNEEQKIRAQEAMMMLVSQPPVN